MFSWLKYDEKREKIREDRKHLEARARRLLKNYLSADGPRKRQYYEVVAGAAQHVSPALLIQTWKIRNSLKSLKSRHRDCRVIRRRGRTYVINKTNRRFKARQG